MTRWQRVRSLVLKPFRKGTPLQEFWRGLGYLFRGTRMVFSLRRDLWVWAFVPVVLSVLLYAAVFATLAFKLDDILRLFLPSPGGGFLRATLFWAAWAVAFAAALLLGYFLFVPLMTIVASPFSDVLSEKVEEILNGNAPPPFRLRVFARELVRMLLLTLARSLVYVAVMAPVTLAGLLVPVAGPIIAFVVGGFFTSLYFAYDGLDRCFARKELRAAQRLRFVRTHFARTLGFGTAGFLLLLVPGAVFVVLPGSTAGAAIFYVEATARTSDAHGCAAAQSAPQPTSTTSGTERG